MEKIEWGSVVAVVLTASAMIALALMYNNKHETCNTVELNKYESYTYCEQGRWDMSKFKVGDKVICTEADLNAYVKESVVYTVAGIPYNDDDEWITLKEVQTRIGTVPQYDATYFKIAVQPKTGDKVRLTTTYVEGETKGEDIEVVEEAPTLYPGAVVQGSYNRLWVMQDDGWFRTTDDEPHYESPERAQQEVAKGNWTIKFEGVKP